MNNSKEAENINDDVTLRTSGLSALILRTYSCLSKLLFLFWYFYLLKILL